LQEGTECFQQKELITFEALNIAHSTGLEQLELELLHLGS
jgi:hypothetical protein